MQLKRINLLTTVLLSSHDGIFVEKEDPTLTSLEVGIQPIFALRFKDDKESFFCKTVRKAAEETFT
ncbi:CLUMA_CG005616, isoform A [Clunio marinus]|uniref:CLUMA_CG005616, isoform A n=1 Tax=Clunio marinus TaxID=568069 RepID=A0A1J1HXG8_9DIPT|nr:CLUMA_CG005616, isoform A [Clunio marinus]